MQALLFVWQGCTRQRYKLYCQPLKEHLKKSFAQSHKVLKPETELVLAVAYVHVRARATSKSDSVMDRIRG